MTQTRYIRATRRVRRVVCAIVRYEVELDVPALPGPEELISVAGVAGVLVAPSPALALEVVPARAAPVIQVQTAPSQPALVVAPPQPQPALEVAAPQPQAVVAPAEAPAGPIAAPQPASADSGALLQPAATTPEQAPAVPEATTAAPTVQPAASPEALAPTASIQPAVSVPAVETSLADAGGAIADVAPTAPDTPPVPRLQAPVAPAVDHPTRQRFEAPRSVPGVARDRAVDAVNAVATARTVVDQRASAAGRRMRDMSLTRAERSAAARAMRAAISERAALPKLAGQVGTPVALGVTVVDEFVGTGDAARAAAKGAVVVGAGAAAGLAAGSACTALTVGLGAVTGVCEGAAIVADVAVSNRAAAAFDREVEIGQAGTSAARASDRCDSVVAPVGVIAAPCAPGRGGERVLRLLTSHDPDGGQR